MFARSALSSFRRMAVFGFCLAWSGVATAQPLDPLSFTSLGTLNLSGGDFTFDTDTLTIVDNAAPGVPLFSGVADDQNGTADYLNGVWVPGSNGIPEIAVFAFDDINLQSSANITVAGTRALAFLSHGNVMIETTIDLSGKSVAAPAMFGDPAPAGVGRFGGFSGGFSACCLPPEAGEGPGGGPGGSLTGNSGGFGAPGYRNSLPEGGPAYGDLVGGPLQGGSGGGSVENAGLGGAAGGGALEISALGSVTLGATGNLIAAGGTTEVFDSGILLGGGAGSGGGIRIQGRSVDLLGSVDAHSFYAAFPASSISRGGGGRVAVFGLNQLFDFIVGQTSTSSINTSNIDVEGGCFPFGGSCFAATRGFISISPQVTSIPSGETLTLGQVTDLSDANRRLELVHHNIRVQQGGLAVVPVDGYVNHATIELFPGGSTLTGPGTLDNRGELSGTGTVATAVNNHAGGNINAINDNLSFTAAVTNNFGGDISAINSSLSFPGDGVPTSGGGDNSDGLTNHGDFNLISTTVAGDVHSPADSNIFVGGTGVVFDGLVSGGGNFPGQGLVTFNGGYAPGDSPAQVSLGGDITLGDTNTLFIELGGPIAGAEYDHVEVAGFATLEGELDVTLINGFTPALGNNFGFLMASGGFDNSFSSLSLPDLSAQGLGWQLNPGGATLFLEVVASLAGDFDGNGDVDGADFLTWQRDSSVGSLTDWEINFGTTAGSLAASSTAVPEPSSLLLGAIASVCGMGFQRRS
jgi:hypothetical protein